jgi:hypothetical protein
MKPLKSTLPTPTQPFKIAFELKSVYENDPRKRKAEKVHVKG